MRARLLATITGYLFGSQTFVAESAYGEELPPPSRPVEWQAPRAEPAPSPYGGPRRAEPRPQIIYREPRPDRLPWSAGEVIPPGYAPTEGPQVRSLVAGIITFGVPYTVSTVAGVIGAGSDSSWATLAIPVVGPFVFLGAGNNFDGSATYVFVLDGLAQVAGATVFSLSFFLPRGTLSRQDVRFGIGPTQGSMEVTF